MMNQEAVPIHQSPSAPAIRLLRVNEVLAQTGMSRTVLYDEIRKGKFPRPMKRGRSSHWRDCDVQGWIAALAATPEPIRQ